MRSIFLIASILATLSSTSAANCTRDGLLSTASQFVTAVIAGQVNNLPTTSNFTNQENNKALALSKGVFASPLQIDTNRSTADTVACASYTMLISTSGPKPYVLATQIRHDGNDTGKISTIDTIAATTGSLFFTASLTLSYIKAEDWSALPAASQPGRDLLKKVGDGYLDMWTDAKAADTIPWGTNCERVEGSRLTKPCGASLPPGGSAKQNDDRRYVVDEVMGSVDVLCAFNSLGNMPDSHEIRVVDGKVKYVHTITVIG
ncbi:uncharacterized protein LY89DRAFT_691344 [Mollisia scopiformis]|uniref:DUF8021 domain-containing protein n=1 Tax=Mollisia scopiformis TaxID=149040 RepID=A0A132B6K8_MOLSC|nr:uncharacterized protein LY89DRAFT_691344 [Mollisia scopiformis]KUJ08042.1 hypothetical protein LY89DRAFT_691344 [Mollisia scopiformis]